MKLALSMKLKVYQDFASLHYFNKVPCLFLIHSDDVSRAAADSFRLQVNLSF